LTQKKLTITFTDMSAGDISSYAKLIYLPRGTGIDRLNVVNFDNIHFPDFEFAILFSEQK